MRFAMSPARRADSCAHRQRGAWLRERHDPAGARRSPADAGSRRQATKKSKINEAQGDASRFTQVAAEYAKASEVNGRRLYLETMEQILPQDPQS